jgi:hypothetical protein
MLRGAMRKYIFLVLVGISASGWSFSKSDLIDFLRSPKVIEKLKGIDLNYDTKDFYSGIHVNLSYVNVGMQPYVTGIKYGYIGNAPSAKIIFSVVPRNQNLNWANYKANISLSNAFVPVNIEIIRFKRWDGQNTIKLDFLDVNGLTRYAEWFNINTRDLFGKAIYDSSGNNLYIDFLISKDSKFGNGFVKMAKHLHYEDIPKRVLFLDSDSKNLDFENDSFDMKLSKSLCEYFRDLK